MLTSFVVRCFGYDPGTGATIAAIAVSPLPLLVAYLLDMPKAGYLGVSLPWWTAIVSAATGGVVYFCILMHQRPENR
jgi:hypothetical protein